MGLAPGAALGGMVTDTLQVRTNIGPDHVLLVNLPEDTPVGDVELTITIRPTREEMTPEQRREAANRGLGILRGVGGSVEEFLAERRAEDARRDKALGL